MNISIKKSAALILLAGIAACKTPPVVTTYPAKPVPAPEPQPVMINDDEFRRVRILADMLYDAKNAFDDNRLMLPAGSNAYETYQQVLQLDPGNAVAMEGIEEIVMRYISLAESAISQGEYDEADGLLGRATRLNPELPELAAVRARLAQARQNRVQIHELDPAELKSQSLEMMTELAEIAQQLQASEATFLIRARTDEEGRWIYKTLRDAVGGYRLRGNIDVSGTPAIVVSTPSNAPASPAVRD
jgi:tetratricopeptide (TPR) repeat protein